ncbi:hypothetical protein [Candidatus Electronema sp. JM]|uniref:hypothetical protein n=1 Tax=Candidatus Electronema sp. JM TaxID=3401571 RepID=UPI003AA82308
MLFVAAPDAAQAKGVSRSKMEAIKIKADNALIVVVKQKEKEAHKLHWKHLHKYAMDNALLAAYYLQVLQQGEEVFEDDANACDSVAGMLLNAVSLISAGHIDRANGVIGRIEVRMGNLPIARAAAVIQIKLDVKHGSLNQNDIQIIVINTRKNDGKVIIVVTGGGNGNNNGGGNDNGNGGGNGGNNDGGDNQDVDCKETAKVEISRACVAGKQTASIEVTVTCKNRTYKKSITRDVGTCCMINADCHEFDDLCMTGECRQGVCWYTKIINPSPATPKCMK